MKQDIEKYLIKIELNSRSYITGEFLCKTQFQIQLLNSIYANEEMVLPNVTLNTCDIKSVSRLNEIETKSYINVVTSKNMLVLPGGCCKCGSEEELKVDECPGIKSIEDGFDSTLESSSDVSGKSLKMEKEGTIESSSEEESSSLMEEEDLKEAFQRKLALRNAGAPSSKPKDPPQTIAYLTPKKPQLSGQKEQQALHNQQPVKKAFKGRQDNEQPLKHLKRREGIHTTHRPQIDNSKRKGPPKQDSNRSVRPPKERIVYVWKQKKYKDGFDILKAISSKFDNSMRVASGWSSHSSPGKSK